MAHVLCLDTEPETIEAIRAAKHKVHAGDMGYRTGRRQLIVPPHEFELIVCDLRRPACFDLHKWGPDGGNNNYSCKLVAELSERAMLHNGDLVFEHQIVHESQLGPVVPGTFGPTDVFAAVEAGVEAILFLNTEWVQRVSTGFPHFFGMRWNVRRTMSRDLITDPQLSSAFPALRKIPLGRPVHYAIKGPELIPRTGKRPSQNVHVVSLVTNKVGDVFAQSVRVGGGTVWVLPPTIDNGAFVVAALERKRVLRMQMPMPAQQDSYWKILHPTVAKVAKSRFDAGHYADSVEAALKEVNDLVRGVVKNKTGKELDGSDLMNFAFSARTPVIELDDLSTISGKNIQIGYMQMFAGAMTGVRNPKAHANITITPERAIHFLFLASLLLSKLDEGVSGMHRS